MGAAQSTSQPEEKVFHNEVPIQFSPDVVNQLSDNLESVDTPPQRQSLIDAHIRARIQGELEALKREEEDVRQQIEAALEKENLDRERSMAGESSSSDEDGSSSGDVKTSAALFGDLEEVKAKIEKYHAKRTLSEHPDIQAASNAVVECYK
ncbi:hypothetical protein CC1G_11761 [Coprinopsis cinerea okayama7|uniref:Uncharacterized protein n=1 Tax=Coprinopsis cinerea (strain Okayama-7 / 130 / ATCC MYA-4618 / FGSC 9003) TaxID=240176 RepID=A8NGL9_COPC7|nr:hypothetical protein CC1G_11761 [Coprinopsis cinerea okayama7\|eukprot:XP_001833555.2 hypothetical protein CC1G_11761 [Coprinopsis cinerea okayama7\